MTYLDVSNSYLFTSEAVSDGHPDKVCDQISDAILDEALRQDSQSKVSIDATVKNQSVNVFGELTTNAEIDFSATVRSVLENIGYADPKWGFEPWKVSQNFNITEQSRELSEGVSKEDGAGDQGIVFGYASWETKEMLPLPLALARRIMRGHKTTRNLSSLMRGESFLGPDAKAQVTIRYDYSHNPLEIDTIVFSSLHCPSITEKKALDGRLGDIVERAIGEYDRLITRNTKMLFNPAGLWTVGGPLADAGLTGRKIAVDTYGGAACHGGGAFSGKDPTKIDRSGAYAARYLAKNFLAWLKENSCSPSEMEVQISYAIGVAEPVSIRFKNKEGATARDFFDDIGMDLTPEGIIERFDLRRPIYAATAAEGHFGHEEYPWEKMHDKEASSIIGCM